jgi:hypothetical protein
MKAAAVDMGLRNREQFTTRYWSNSAKFAKHLYGAEARPGLLAPVCRRKRGSSSATAISSTSALDDAARDFSAAKGYAIFGTGV